MLPPLMLKARGSPVPAGGWCPPCLMLPTSPPELGAASGGTETARAFFRCSISAVWAVFISAP